MNGEKQIEKKSLLNSLKYLENKASELEDLVFLNNKVLEKLNNPRPYPKPEDLEGKQDCVKEEGKDLIDLFNDVAKRIEKSTNRMNEIVENLSSIID